MCRPLILVLAVAGLSDPSFCLPPRRDETTYLIVAEDMAHEKVLDRDTWDTASRGICAWCYAAGRRCGSPAGLSRHGREPSGTSSRPSSAATGRETGFHFPEVGPRMYPDLTALLASDYRVAREAGDGVWSERID